MLGRIYTATFVAVAVTAAQDLFEITAPADAIVLLHEIGLSQHTEVKDAEEEMMRVSWKSGATSTGTGGSQGITCPPLNFGDPAFGGVVDTNNTTPASGGTIVTHYAWAWNVRIPFQMIFTPETRPCLSPSRRGTLELLAAPGDSITMNGYCVFEEIGG